jgi:hypothetical protein
MRGPVNMIAALLILALVSLPYAGRLVDRPVTIKLFAGRVSVKSHGEKAWREAKIGMKLRSRDKVRTFAGARADLETAEGTVVDVLENTVFELTELVRNTRTRADITRLSVMTGSIRANVRPLTSKRSSFVFETPTATVAVLGTEVGIDVTEGRTRVKVREGVVEVRNRAGGKASYVFDNQEAVVTKDTPGVSVGPLKADTGTGPKPLLFEITAPAENAVFTDTSIALSGKTAPAAVIRIQGWPDLQADTSGSFSTTLGYPEGTLGHQKITLTAIHRGAAAVRKVHFTIKKPEPKAVTLSIDEPLDNAVIITRVIKVTGTTTPGAVVKFEDGQETVSGDGNFAVWYRLPASTPGTYKIKCKAWVDLEGAIRTDSVKVNLIEMPKNIFILINSPTEGQEFVKTNLIPVHGLTLPGAKVTFGSDLTLTADAMGMFKGIYELPRKYGVHQLSVKAVPTTLRRGRSRRTLVKVKIVPPAGGCAIQITEPAQGADVPPVFEVKGTVENPNNNARVKVNGVPAAVVGSTWTAKINSGFSGGQTGALSLAVTSPAAGARLTRLPVVFRGKVSPPMAKVLLDGVKEARVYADGTFEGEYPMPDEAGEYIAEVSAVLEIGEAVKKKFDVTVASECNKVKFPPARITVNVGLGAAAASDEVKKQVPFHYERQRFDMILLTSPPVCKGDKIVIEVKTNAVELLANGRILPLAGTGGEVRAFPFEIDNTDRACFQAADIVFSAVDASAKPGRMEATVTVNCPVQNTEKPEIVLTPQLHCLDVRVFDRSFQCSRAREAVAVTVEASGQGQIQEFIATRNGVGQCVPYVEGVGVLYTVRAADKAKNPARAVFTHPGYIRRPPRITLVSPRVQHAVITERFEPPPYPMGVSGEGEIELQFRIEDVENYRLIKRVEVRSAQAGLNEIFEGARIPTDLEFDNIYLRYGKEAFSDATFSRPGRRVYKYVIQVFDVAGRAQRKEGRLTVRGEP